MADLISDLKLLRDLGLHGLHPFLIVSLTEMVDYNEHFFRYIDFLPSKQGPTYINDLKMHNNMAIPFFT